MKLLIVFLLDFYDEYSYRILLKDLGTDAYNSNIKSKMNHNIVQEASSVNLSLHSLVYLPTLQYSQD